MKQQVDQHRSEQSFNVVDQVFLRLQPYKQMSLKNTKKDDKLSPKYYGPYKVLQKISSMAYKLELPASSRVHLVFHVSYLKKVSYDTLPVLRYYKNLMGKEKSSWSLKKLLKYKLNSFEIDQFHSNSLNGRTYP